MAHMSVKGHGWLGCLWISFNMYPHSARRMCTQEDIGNPKKSNANASVAMGTATVVSVSQKGEMHICVCVQRKTECLKKRHHKQKEKLCHFLPERFNSPTLTKLPVCCEVHVFIFSFRALKQ